MPAGLPPEPGWPDGHAWRPVPRRGGAAPVEAKRFECSKEDCLDLHHLLLGALSPRLFHAFGALRRHAGMPGQNSFQGAAHRLAWLHRPGLLGLAPPLPPDAEGAGTGRRRNRRNGFPLLLPARDAPAEGAARRRPKTGRLFHGRPPAHHLRLGRPPGAPDEEGSRGGALARAQPPEELQPVVQVLLAARETAGPRLFLLL